MSRFSILLLGYSSIAKKAIIPALKNHSQIYLKAIASKGKYSLIPKSYLAYKSYKKAIDESECDIVYISLHNSAHFPWILYALKRKRHVICDKPLLLNLKEAQKCYRQAEGKLLIFESLPYLYHKQHQILKKMIKQQKNRSLKMTINFGFPSLEAKNYRNFIKFGGGCLNDIGPYLTSCGSYYFDTLPKEVYTVASYNYQRIPTSASVTIKFSDNKVLQGHIGFNLEYRNSLEIWGKTFYFKINRALSTPPDFDAAIIYKIKDREGIKRLGFDNSFSNMFSYIGQLLRKKNFSQENLLILKQAAALEAINKSGKIGKSKKNRLIT